MTNNVLTNDEVELDLCLNSTSNEPGNLFHLQKPHYGEEFSDFVAPMNTMMVGGDGRYSSRMMNSYEREHWWIPMDHCYARPWNWRPESTFLKPTKTLFMQKPPVRRRYNNNPLAQVQEQEDVVDVEADQEDHSNFGFKSKMKQTMDECEKYAAAVKPEEGSDDWEENISKINWNSTQNRLFNGIVSILNSDHLARMSMINTPNESITRRITIDKSVSRFRKLMATVSWEAKYTQWLHQLLFDNLSKEYLGIYLDLLQTLRSKLPLIVDKLLSNGGVANKNIGLNHENLFNLLKKPWDPLPQALVQEKPKKLPGNPIFLVVPSAPTSSRRLLKWVNLIYNLSLVVTVPTNIGNHKSSIVSCLDQMFVMTRNKIQDLRVDYPGRHIVLVGFGFGATLALQVAQVEQVLGVVCMGFSLYTADGKRGEQDDNLMELLCPVLFVIGQNSHTSLQEDMEDLRERMRVETGLIVVGSADDNLRVSKKKKKLEGITQSVVDRCIVDEIGEFISGIILSPYPPQLRQSPTNLTTDGTISKKLKNDRKRYTSNGSMDSEPPSPTPRLPRPGRLGRPPGSKSRARLDPKWAVQQGGRYITSKRQLIGNKPPKPVKKMTYMPSSSSYQNTLPPPTNLTTQDIMDLPIIFADDNQLIEPETKQIPSQMVSQPKMLANTPSNGKFMVINKPSNFIIAPNTTPKMPQGVKPGAPKFTKIILSSKRNQAEDSKAAATSGIMAKISSLSSEISVKKIVAPADTASNTSSANSQYQGGDLVDLENEITANTVYKSTARVAALEASESTEEICVVDNPEDSAAGKRSAIEAGMLDDQQNTSKFTKRE